MSSINNTVMYEGGDGGDENEIGKDRDKMVDGEERKS